MDTIHNILVPLDGSVLAEAALPAAVWLSRIYDARITLLHVIERNAPTNVHGERHLTNEQDAMAYLKSVAQSFPANVETEQHVHNEEVSNVPRSIAAHAGELSQDLVVMCSHGKGGLRQFMVGNIAQQVIGQGKTPVLLIQPEQDPKPLFENPACFLVALDDEPEHACGLEMAGSIAKRSGVELHLLNVVPKLDSLKGYEAATGRLLPAATTAMLEMQQEEANLMLANMAKPYLEQDVRVTWEVRRGDPPTQIAQRAQEIGASIIVLGTHGKAGMGAFWAGSVAPRMPEQTELPLLLVPTCPGR